MDLKTLLNPSQYLAVTTIEGPVLVIAGAGSGKTRVIEYRVLNLVLNNISPASTLLLTFTRRAAGSMLSRASIHDRRCQNIEGGTFHSFAYKMLKKYGSVLNIPESFSILDEVDAEDAIHRCTVRMGIEKVKGFPKKGTIKNIFSQVVNKSISIEDILMKQYYYFLDYVKELKGIMQSYTRYKKDSAYFDYDDLLLYLKFLLGNKDVQKKITSRYQYVMVDEYQDTNMLQGDITYLLSGEKKNIMIVGDDAQSIYGFRGSSHKNIMEFPKKFPGCRVIKLEENYRSTQSILNIGNCVLQNMKNKYSKCLISVKKGEGESPKLFAFDNACDEAEWIVDTIKELKEKGIPLSEQSVLFRSSYISIPLQAEISKRGIPYRVFGGKRFYESSHIKDILAYLKILVNQKDEISWNRILRLIEGIGPKTSEQIYKNLVSQFSREKTLRGSFLSLQGHKYTQNLEKLGAVIDSLYMSGHSVEQAFRRMLEYYLPILKENYDDWMTRAQDINTLGQISSRYNSLQEMLSDFAIEGPIHNSAPEDTLTLSTIHSAKGLEWECVFLIGLMDGVIPNYSDTEDEEEIEEEHRLFYVAITRAKYHLFLSMHHQSNKWNNKGNNQLSRFLSENVLSRIEYKSAVL